MKKILALMIAFPAFSICFAQTRTDTTTKTVLTKSLPTSTATQTLKTPAVNTMVTKLPDLRISAANVAAVSTGPGVYKLTIQCTIKNDGNAPISLANISISGLLAPDSYMDKPLNSTAFSAGCGTTAGLASETLQPGASVSTEYFCFNRPLSPGEKPVYVVLLNRFSDVKELNIENNRQNVYVTFK